MRIEIRDLRLVHAIVEMGNLTRAGQQLHLTQSALSHQLSDLEQRVGGQLFERAGRKLIPTRLGARLGQYAAGALTELRAMEVELTNMVEGKDAVLRLATECYTCYHWLPPVLESFRARRPSVDVRIVPEATSRPQRALVAGAIDLYVGVTRARDRRVLTIPLFDDELVLLVNAAHPLASHRSVAPSDMKDERFLAYTEPDDNWAYRDVLAPAGVRPSQVSVVRLTEAIVELVKANLGVSLLARWAAEPYLASDALRAVRVDHAGAKRSWFAGIRRGTAVPEHLHDFIDALRESVTRPPRRREEFTVLRSVARFSRATKSRAS